MSAKVRSRFYVVRNNKLGFVSATLHIDAQHDIIKRPGVTTLCGLKSPVTKPYDEQLIICNICDACQSTLNHLEGSNGHQN